MKRFWTADLHLGHSKVIGFCERPFSSVEEMDQALIKNWNEVVLPEDEIFVLGDFSFHGSIKTKAIVSQLNGRKIAVLGNHDASINRMSNVGFDLVFMNGSMRLGDRNVFISHYPFEGKEDDERRFPGLQFQDDGKKFLIHGHVHRSWKRNERMINVGVDVWDYRPVSEKQIIDLIEGRG